VACFFPGEAPLSSLSNSTLSSKVLAGIGVSSSPSSRTVSLVHIMFLTTLLLIGRMSNFTFHEFLLLPYDTTAPKNINLFGMSLGIMLCCSSVSRIWYSWNHCIFTLLHILMFALVLFFDRPVVCGGVLHFLAALVTGPDGCST